jgi:hypothetical protein
MSHRPSGEQPDAWLDEKLREYPDWVTAEDVRFAYARLARIFGLPPEGFAARQRFGSDLPSSFDSLLKPNELKRVYFDVEDITQEFGADVTIPDDQAGTVGGYCLLLAKASRQCARCGHDLRRILQAV